MTSAGPESVEGAMFSIPEKEVLHLNSFVIRFVFLMKTKIISKNEILII